MPNVIDIIAFIICGLSAFQGFRRGLSGELARLISVIVAFTLGVFFYRPFGAWLLEYVRLGEQPAYALAFLVTVIGAVAIMILLRLVLKRIMKIIFAPAIDKTGGCAAGFLRAVVVILIIFVMINMWPHDYLNKLFGEESLIGRGVLKIMPTLREKYEETKGT